MYLFSNTITTLGEQDQPSYEEMVSATIHLLRGEMWTHFQLQIRQQEKQNKP